MTNFPPPQVLYIQVSVLIIHWYCFQASYARAHLAKRNKFASKITLDYFGKKYPEYANNWLVSQIAGRDGERHGSSCRMQYFNNYLTRVITSQKLLQRVAVML